MLQSVDLQTADQSWLIVIAPATPDPFAWLSSQIDFEEAMLHSHTIIVARERRVDPFVYSPRVDRDDV